MIKDKTAQEERLIKAKPLPIVKAKNTFL